MGSNPTQKSRDKWPSLASSDFLQLIDSNKNTIGWIDSSGTPQGTLATAAVTPFLGVPTGPCLQTQTAVDTTTGNFYSCVGGSWLKVGPGAAGTLSSPIVTPNPLAFDVDLHFKGPTPWADITRFGARAIPTNTAPAIPGITASITATQITATLSDASSFQKGDGVVIYGAGATHSMTTPTGLTVTPSLAKSGTGTGLVVNGITGATTYNYQIIARNKQGGMTAASPVASTTTGAASLGRQTVNITSLSKSGLINTAVTASAHGLSVGAMVAIQGTSSDVDFGGWFRVNTVPDNTHFTYANGRDSANGSTTSATGGTAVWYNCNRLSWTAVTGAFQYYIYGRTGGSLTLLGVSRPDGSNGGPQVSDDTWDDFGSPMMDNFTAPYFVPTTPPGAATSNHLVTTISSGAGTTTLTLANAAGTTVSGAMILFDNTPAIMAADTFSASNGRPPIFTPVGTFVTNSYLTVGPFQTLSMEGGWSLNDTVEIGGSVKWYGDRVPIGGGAGSFSYSSSTGVNSVRATPSVFMPGPNGMVLKGLTFSSSQANNGISLIVDSPNEITMEDINFYPSTGTSVDYMSIGYFQRSAPNPNAGSFLGNFRNITLTAAQSVQTDTPLFTCTSCGGTQIHRLSMSGRGLHFGGVQSLYIENGRIQASSTPFLVLGGYPGIGGDNSGPVTVREIDLDTSGPPLVATLTSSVTSDGEHSIYTIENSGTPSSLVPNISGSPIGNLLMIESAGIGQNTHVTQIIGGAVTTTGNGTGIRAFGTSQIGYAMAQPAAPTVVLGGAGSCVSNCVAAGSYVYQVLPIDITGKNGPISPSSATVVTDGTKTITVSWVPVSGQVLTARFRSFVNQLTNIAGMDSPGTGISGTSYTDINSNSYSVSPPASSPGNSISLSSFGIAGGLLTLSPVLFANLGTPTNGTFANCSDCTVANPCAGGGTGAFAKRFNGVWVCN
jgi:hypothetical protein